MEGIILIGQAIEFFEALSLIFAPHEIIRRPEEDCFSKCSISGCVVAIDMDLELFLDVRKVNNIRYRKSRELIRVFPVQFVTFLLLLLKVNIDRVHCLLDNSVHIQSGEIHLIL